MKTHVIAMVMTAAVLFVGQVVLADGMIVPVRPELPVRGHWSVKYHHVKVTVRDQVASVHIDQEFVNDSHGDIEVEYLFPIPPGAAIDSMTMVVDGKELTGKLMEAAEARKIYEDIVRRKKDPALLEYMGSGLYRTRAFPLQRGKPARVVVTYKTVCRKDYDLVEVFYPLNTEKFSSRKIDDVKVTVDIKAKADITAVYSPTHDLNVDRKDPRHVIATYKVENAIPDTDFQVYYKSADEKIGATVLTYKPDGDKDGYFMMLVSPNPGLAGKAVGSKDIVIALDRSGSMSTHNKIGQAKESLRYVLGSLGEEDRFNVITFSDSVDTFFPKMVDATKKNVDEALEMLDRIEATGGTALAEAVNTSLGMCDKSDRPKYVLFLTDGLPTIGERDEGEIIKASKKANQSDARLFAFGVGYDVNVRLIDNLVRANRGVSDYVKEAEPLEAKISSLYNKIKRPVMTDVKTDFEGVKTTMTYPQELPDLFDGGQILMVGRYDDGGKTTLEVTGKLEGKTQRFEYEVTLAKLSESTRNAFVERLWAVRRVGFLLDQIQLNGESKEVVDELVRISKKYGIMTPYTAFLADESVNLGKSAELRERAGHESGRLADSYKGVGGQMDATNRGKLNMATRAPAASGVRHDQSAEQFGYSDGHAYEAGERKRIANVQNVGNQTLYRRGNVWLAPGTEKLDLKKDAEKIKEIRRFDKEYFELVRKNTIEQNQVLASQRADEELVINLRGQTYRIR
ncbi:MAG: VIT and VWA domain-containing protein [Planctomycetota bacterium]|nr:VIT and VWA domain-containing protein [Planctomycetota bacterium]